MSWIIGKKHTKESIDKMKKAQKLAWKKNPNKSGLTGKHRSKELIEKWHNEESIKNRFKKGLIPWNKGRKLTKKEIQKMKEKGWWSKGQIPWWIKKGVSHPTKSEAIKEKMRAKLKGRTVWNKGIPMREESRKKLSLSIKGENHPFFNNWSSREPYGKEWSKELKEKIRQWDNFRCQQCFRHQDELYRKGKKYKLLIHHIDYNKKNNSESNLISLCNSCHSQTNYSREDWTKHFQESMNRGIYA